MVKAIRIEQDVPMKMRDGTVLRADVYRPDDSEKHPAILIRSPYGKQRSADSDYLNVEQTAFAGYAVVAQDVRGRFASEGDYMDEGLLGKEPQDGYDSVEWVAAEPWCDGNVGTHGGSYLAILQWLLAMENPPHLRAILPRMGQAGPVRETSLLGGAGPIYMGVSWAAMMGLGVADKLEKQGKDVSKIRGMLRRAIFNTEEVLNYLPLKSIPHFDFDGIRELWQLWVLKAVPQVPEEWLSEIDKKIYWDYSKVTAAGMYTSGWYDINPFSAVKNFKGMTERGGTQKARESQHLLMGPWGHSPRLPGFIGDLQYGPMAGIPMAMITEYSLSFYDRYLRGKDVKIPRVRYFVMGRNLWQEVDTWPVPGTEMTSYYLHSRGKANSNSGDGVLSRDEPGKEPPDVFTYDPHNPVPTTGGRFTARSPMMAGPIEQYHVEKRPDMLCYTTPELKEDIEITGEIELHLFAATSARDTDFMAKLVDVYPDGRAYNVSDGMLRARYRKSIFQPELVKPDDVNEYVIRLSPVSQLFHKGHRIRLSLTSSDFPAYDRNMNTGNPVGEDATGIKARQSVYHESAYPSYIVLPVIPAKLSP